MRFMALVKTDETAEKNYHPSTELLAAMGRFNEEMMDAGVLLAGEGLQPPSKGVRITWLAGKATISEGPFLETIGNVCRRRDKMNPPPPG